MQKKKIFMVSSAFLTLSVVWLNGCVKKSSVSLPECEIAGREVSVFELESDQRKDFSKWWFSDEQDRTELFYVGDTVCLSFENLEPETLEIWEIMTDPEDGEALYGTTEEKEIFYKWKEGRIVYPIEENIASMYSSEVTPTELRTYVAEVTVKNQKYQYVFFAETESEGYAELKKSWGEYQDGYNSYITSKWGAMPLVYHFYTDCFYWTNNNDISFWTR